MFVHVSQLTIPSPFQAAREENQNLKIQHQESTSQNDTVQAEQGKTHQDQLEQAKKKLEASIAEFESQKVQSENAHRVELDALKAEAEAQKTQRDTAHRAEIDAVKSENENQKSQRDNAHRSEVQTAHDELNRLRPKVLDELNGEEIQILAVTYGNMVFFDQGTPDHRGVVPKFLNAAVHQQSFRIENGIFNHDPNPGRVKYMVVIYRYNKSGQSTRLRTLVGEEGNTVAFDRY
jgi:hypothetical protein